MGGSLGLASGQLVTPDYAAVDNGEETSRSLLGSTALHTVLQSNNGNTRDTGARGEDGDPPTCTALEKGISYHPLR